MILGAGTAGSSIASYLTFVASEGMESWPAKEKLDAT